MVSWIERQKYLRTIATRDTLTPSQRESYDTIVSLSQKVQRINLFGETGVGKTFVAWALAKDKRAYHYFPTTDLPDVPSNIASSSTLVIDDAPHGRLDARALAAQALERGSGVVLITRRAIDDHVFHCHLVLVENDFQVFTDSMRQLLDPEISSPQGRTGMLWNYFS